MRESAWAGGACFSKMSLRAFMVGCGFLLAFCGWRGYFRGEMTRSSIELSIKVFLCALIVTFIWTVVKVIGMIS